MPLGFVLELVAQQMGGFVGQFLSFDDKALSLGLEAF